MSNVNNLEIKSTITAEKLAATREWIESQETNCDDDISSCSSIVEETCTDESDDDDEMVMGTETAKSNIGSITESFKDILNSISSVSTVGNVTIVNSTGVHVGNVTNINGNIQIFQTTTSNRRRKKKINEQKTSSSNCSEIEEPDKQEECVSKEAFLDRTKFKIPSTLCNILPRHTWLAQRHMEEYDKLEEPVLYVVISHTATESSEKRAINIRTIRDIQCFHIESRGWNDIAYNFLIGCDGNIYEGRGWGIVGAHTMGYNIKSIGISFIGCFMKDLPNKAALTACKNLLKKGVEDGHLSSNYKLITHSQCCSTESPGRRLVKELETWDHFYKIENEEDD